MMENRNAACGRFVLRLMPEAMLMNVHFTFVRHGETAWNIDRRLQGHLDVPLNEVGRRQAGQVAEALANERFDAIYSSDLSRAMDTARAIAARCGGEVQGTERLRERNYGIFQGLTHKEGAARYPEEHARLMAREPDHIPTEGGESMRMFSERIRTLADELATRWPDGRVLVVTHGGVLYALRNFITGAGLSAPRDFTIPNAGINRIRYRVGGPYEIEVWGDDRHLTTAGRDETMR